MNVEHRTFNIEHRMGGAQSRREKRLNIFLFKILASLREKHLLPISAQWNGGCRQLSKLMQALDPHTEGKDYTEEEKGVLLDSGVLVLGRCHLIRFGLLSDYE